MRTLFFDHLHEIIIAITSSAILALLLRFWKLIIPQVKITFMFWHKDYYLNRIRRSGITNFYVGRSDWIKYRKPDQLKEYLLGATRSVQIATYWLAQGTIEGIQESYLELVSKGIRVDIVMIDSNEHLVKTLSQDLHISTEVIKNNIEHAYTQLCQLKERMLDGEKSLFRVGFTAALPQAAVIMIDAKTPKSKIQLEFRPYRTARGNSFSIELKADKNAYLHQQLEEAWERFFEDAIYS